MKTADGIVIICNHNGIILKIINDELKITEDFPEGKLFSSCFPIEDLHKALDFIVAVKNEGAVHSIDINVLKNEQLITLHFGGIMIEGNIVIVASQSRDNTETYFSEMMNMNNELINTLRLLYKDKSSTSSPIDDNKSSLLYDELSRLNNQLVNMQREIAQKNAELEKLNKLKVQFLGMAAHDLRNPLGALRSFIEILEKDGDNFNAEQMEMVSYIRHLSSFMLGLVDDLLDVSNIDSGNLSIDLSHVDLIELIKKILTFNRMFADSKNISLKLVTTIDKCPINVDPNKVNQILTNLISNAVKYSFHDTNIQVTLTKNEKSVVVSVKDEGQGIPEKELPKLFGAFQKTSVRSTDGESSTGLGLLITKKMVEGHGGEIWVESKVGKGSTFSFSLPF